MLSLYSLPYWPGPIPQRFGRRRVGPGLRRDDNESELLQSRSGPVLRHAEHPGALQPGFFLIGGDLGTLLLGQADIVEPVQQTMLAERVDLEMHDLAIGARDRLLVEVDRQRRIGAFARVVHQ